MKRINLCLLIILSILYVVTSCKQDYSLACGGFGCPTPYTGIMANSAPYINVPYSSLLFIVASVTTDSSLYSPSYFNCPRNEYLNVTRTPNTNGNNQPVTFVYGSANLSSTSSGVIFNGDTLSNYCGIPYLELQVSTTLSLAPPTTWALYGAVNTIYIDSSAAPVAPTITNAYSIPTNTGFTLQGAGPVLGDSVIFLIWGSKGGYQKTLPPGSLSCSFTSGQMDSIGTTTSSNPGLLQIATYHVSHQGAATLVKEACFSKYVQFR